jgi:hypothetical protein
MPGLMVGEAAVPDRAVHRWVGNGYLPGRGGLWGLSGPFVVVEVAGSRVTVRLQPRFFARLLGVEALIADPSSGLTVTTRPVRMGFGRFIDFQLPDGRPYSLITNRSNEVLSCLAEEGFQIPVADSRRGR